MQTAIGLPLLLFGLSVATVPAAPIQTSHPSYWRHAHPDAKALAGVDWQRLKSSPFGELVLQELRKKGMDARGVVDLLDSVDRILLSSPGSTDGARREPPMLITAQGRFDLAKLRKKAMEAGSVSRRFQSVEILSPKKKRDDEAMHVALLSPQTVLLGDQRSVEKAIVRKGLPMAGEIFARAAQLAEGSEIWLVARMSPSDFTGAETPQGQMMSAVQGIESSLSFRDGMALRLRLDTENEESAAALAGGIQMMMGMGAASQAENKQLAELARKVRIQPDGAAVAASVQISLAEMQSGLEQMRAAASEPNAPAGGPDTGLQGSVKPAAQARPPARRTIIVYGMEDGPLEIPFEKR